MSSNVEFQRVNVDNKEDPLYQQYSGQFRGIPAILWLDESGQIVAKTNGFSSEEAFEQAIQRASNSQ